MIYYFFIGLFLFLSFVGDKSARVSCFIIFLFSSFFTLLDNVMLGYDFVYSDHVFVALLFSFSLSYVLVNFCSSRVATRQSVILSGALIIHTLMLIDVKTGTNVVYDGYEKLLLFITIIQMAVSNDKFTDGVIDTSQRILLLLCWRSFHCKNHIRHSNENKDGAFEA